MYAYAPASDAGSNIAPIRKRQVGYPRLPFIFRHNPSFLVSIPSLQRRGIIFFVLHLLHLHWDYFVRPPEVFLIG